MAAFMEGFHFTLGAMSALIVGATVGLSIFGLCKLLVYLNKRVNDTGEDRWVDPDLDRDLDDEV